MRLYLDGVDKGAVRMKGKTGIAKFAVSGTGPGLIFMAFGGLVLVTTLTTGGASIETVGGDEPSRPTATSSDAGLSTTDIPRPLEAVPESGMGAPSMAPETGLSIKSTIRLGAGEGGRLFLTEI